MRKLSYAEGTESGKSMSKMRCDIQANLICSMATRMKTIQRRRMKILVPGILMMHRPARHWQAKYLGQLPESLQSLNKLRSNHQDTKRPLPTEQASLEVHPQNTILIQEEVPLLLRHHSQQVGNSLPRTITNLNQASLSTTHLHLHHGLERCQPMMVIPSHLQDRALVQPSRIQITTNPLLVRVVNMPTLDLIFPRHQQILINRVLAETHEISLGRRGRMLDGSLYERF